MPEVENKIFAHIHTISDIADYPNKYSEKWTVGNKFFFGDEGSDNQNIFHETILNPYINLDREKSFIKNLSQKIQLLKSPQEIDELEKLFLRKGMLYSYFQFTREIVLEQVRQTLFPQKPSRTNAIWLTDMAFKDRWINIFSEFNLPYKVFLIKFTGKIHKADARWLTDNSFPLSFKSYYKIAKGYWNGELQSSEGNPDEEYIGNGFVEIIQEIT